MCPNLGFSRSQCIKLARNLGFMIKLLIFLYLHQDCRCVRLLFSWFSSPSVRNRLATCSSLPIARRTLVQVPQTLKNCNQFNEFNGFFLLFFHWPQLWNDCGRPITSKKTWKRCASKVNNIFKKSSQSGWVNNSLCITDSATIGSQRHHVGDDQIARTPHAAGYRCRYASLSAALRYVLSTFSDFNLINTIL